MKSRPCFSLVLLFALALWGFSCDERDSCDAGEIRICQCPDGAEAEQSCRADGGGFGPCGCTTYSVWCDPETDLCWQNPQKDARTAGNGGVSSFDAIRYCEELVLGGHADWRLPSITELRTLIAGNRPTEADGACYIEEGSAMNDQPVMKLAGCVGKLTSLDGPGSGGCYWKAGVEGGCADVDPASTSHFLEYWSATPSADDPENWVAYVFFDSASVGFNHALSLGEVRCVRDAPGTPVVCDPNAVLPCFPGVTRSCACGGGKPGAQVCRESSNCYGPCDCAGFVPSPRPADVCDRCDQVKVTIRVPRNPAKQPYLLAAFLYESGQLSMRPPDVGSYENEIRYPEIGVDRPIEMTIPGCSYYRDRCMVGDYYLVVYLKMKEGKFPGMPDLGDMVWMDTGADPITLTGDGTKRYVFDVTLVPMNESWELMI